RPAKPGGSNFERRRHGGLLAYARELFLSAEPIDDGVVRENIMASWQRSRDSLVSADHFELRYDPNPNTETELARSASEVVEDAAQQFGGEPVSVVLTDSDGVVLDRRTGDSRLRQKLDRVSLAPGFSYAEQFVGTNGIGTALQGGRATEVFGHEHYVEHLEDLACAGAPIRHPTSGTLLGIIDLTCWRHDANAMMSTVATGLARRIEDELLTHVRRRELELMQHYIQACQRSGDPVLAISNNLVMMNDSARTLIPAQDQNTLIGEATEGLTGPSRRTVTTTLPSGLLAELTCLPTETGPTSAGVIYVRLANSSTPIQRKVASAVAASSNRIGLAGSSAPWIRCRRAVAAHFTSGEHLDLYGEQGVGKLALLRATHFANNPAGHLRVLDAAEQETAEMFEVLGRELAGGAGTLVVRHIDLLSMAAATTMRRLLDDAPSGGPWVAVTRRTASAGEAAVELVLEHFPHSIEVPPLRHRIEDLPELTTTLLNRLSKDPAVTVSPEALRVLMRHHWPGNVAQLYDVLRKSANTRRAGMIALTDLPPECLATSRHVLSQLESLERDAIVESLIDADGDRASAAHALGISRSTIYRKIRDYGIVLPYAHKS
ncbi:MAG: sigma-54-dependent Fis family transcriptional regulator, partial [Sciscionella sp.]